MIRNKVKVTLIEDKKREIKLEWICHVKKRSVEAPVGRSEMIYLLKCRRSRRRPKKSWDDKIIHDLKFRDMTLG